MSFLHTHSSECIKSELDFFSLPPTQTSIESSQWIYYKPVTSLTDDSPIEFVIPGHGEDYLDLTHTMLSLRIRVESERGESTSVAATDVAKAGPVNHLLHSMFNQIDVYFNQKLVSQPNNAYAYRAYIEALLNYASPAKTSHLTSCLWDADIPVYMDDMLDSSNPNTALERRAKYIQGNRALDLVGHLHCDVFNQDKFLINGVEVRMRLVRSKDSFCLMETRTMSKIHADVVGESIDNAILGQLPKRIIVGFVDNKAFNGDRKLNPFNFKNYKIFVDGTLFAFDLTPDLSANCAGHWNLVKHGSLRLEVRFEKALSVTINCTIYAEFDNVLKIDSSRQVIVDFSG
ncbi:Uncharacterized protein F54H12.2 [Trachymyrmex cornetzi]|uniref:Uncharacterized protein F54H12.2 n=1 Tax=Trachymyrmex cornetzi TaxID=471704 RepID=A0A151IYH4_9HYME|nr:Uncharacterized protein F54H12.2 [Trachymyrmex cornetzi]